MNARAIGCIGLGAVVFILIGILGINVASSRIGCPDRLQWGDRLYAPTGTPAPSPDTGGSEPPAKLGTSFIGLTTREVYGPAGSTSSDAPGRTSIIAMDCGDGRFQSYRNAGPAPTATPSAEAMLREGLRPATRLRTAHG
ncbi:MAG: hypothetical protein E6I62_03265 [Chloroflexi bacterium]|nr:MAG: hypothetical protein E6I62_03265 [Chloroflexota bacterium]